MFVQFIQAVVVASLVGLAVNLLFPGLAPVEPSKKSDDE